MIVLTTAGLALVLAAGCAASGGTTGPVTAAPTCSSPGPPSGPGSNASLGDADSGGTFCLSVGQTLDVYLHVPAAEQATRWSVPVPSRTDILEPRTSGALTLPVGVTAAVLAAVGRGVVTVSASRPGGQRWDVAIVVR